MIRSNPSRFGLSAFVLKVIAAVTMTVDHVGAYLYPDVDELRIIGRLAFPIFAFLIADGCRYTRNRLKRFVLVFGLCAICEAGFYLLSGEITGTVLLTFSGSILIIYALQFFKKCLVGKVWWRILLSALLLGGVAAGGYLLAEFLPVDYGFAGMLLPVLVSLFDYREGEAPRFLRHLDRHPIRLCMALVGILAVWYFRGQNDIQFLAVLALIPLAFYNGRPGPRKFKYWFYIFYPAHLGVIQVIGILLDK